ncbi:pyocin knob domain-containing protein [Haemophilus seminalis]|uniref:pyocin knob domain-containing protein n=1 Tax=Haemophilus seminalis TaxID=2582921 RepID=UPI001C644BF4|nr:pyocin knob domain-containing protein [Haemophilus seminalis]
MALVNKPDESIFASSAKQGEVDNFPDLLRGWGITFDQTQGIPPMEWFNFLFKRLDEKHAYLMQRGLPEWSATQDYTKGSCVQFEGLSYRALKNSKNNSPNESDSQHWVRWGFALSEIARATLQQPGIVQLSSSTNSESESEAATSKAVKIAHELAESKQSPATTLAGYGINNFKVENGSGNMNDYRTDGIYCFDTLYGVSNSPRDTNSDIWSGNLQVITGGIGNERWCRQIFHVHYSKDTYIRWQVSVTNDDWSAWEKLNDIEPVIRALGTKANISHTHTANQITDFNTAVRNSFSGVSSENGWCKLPNGLILQWGKITLPNLTNEKTGVCTLPVTFPLAVFSIIIGGVSGSISQDGNSQEGFSITQQTTSNFTWVSSWEYRNKDAFNNAPAQWIAIGY